MIDISVSKDNVCLMNEKQVHKNEVNVDTLVFHFSEEYTDDLVKIAVFTTAGGTTYRMTILNNECVVPYEVLLNREIIVLGVYAYQEQDGELVKRYSPTPLNILVQNGSYVDSQEGTILVPAMTLEEYEQAIQEALTQFELDKDAIIQEAKEEFDTYYNGKVDDFDTNATNKTNTFNNNATDKTNSYNSNATDKTNSFNSNATDKTTAFNNNATNKTNDFNSNATDKTTAFNNNYTDKLGDFNTNATNKTTAFNDNASQKTTDFNNNAEAIMQMNELLLNAQPTNTATGETIHVTDSAKLPLANFEMIGNATQADTPTPTTPQAMHLVTGNNTVKLTEKNLIPFTTQDFTINNVRYYVQNGSLYFNGTSTSETSSANQQFLNNFSLTLPAGTYRLSHKTGVNAVSFRNASTNTQIALLGTDVASISITLAEQTEVFIGFYVYQKTFSNVNTEIMLEVGSTATDYVAYQGEQSKLIPLGDIQLCKIENYKDRIFKAEVGKAFYDSLTDEQKATLTLGKWYVYKAISKSVYNGSESWTLNTNYNAYSFFRTVSDSYSVTVEKICNRFKWANIVYSSSSATTPGLYVNGETGKMDIFKTDGSYGTTVAQWKEWLSNNNTIVYYPLLTPTFIEITDTALITALEQVLAMTTYKTTTNAFTLTVSDNATPTLVMEYRQDIGTLISNLNNAILSLGNNV